ncbi:MAG: hypothetical protein ACRCSN_20370, partial [Dermatophilaceae bacterium]
MTDAAHPTDGALDPHRDAFDLADPAVDPSTVATAAADVIRARTGADRHDIALVLGSGWGRTADLVGETLVEVEGAEVPGF